MPRSIPRDLISFLPPEILSTIFDLAYSGNLPPRGPINRALLPFQRRVLFRYVQISSPSKLEQFTSAIGSDRALGLMIRSLRIKDVGGPEDAPMEKRRLETLFSALVNLEQLKIEGRSTSFIDFVLSPSVTLSWLLRLESLGLQVPRDWKDPFDSARYSALDKYLSLTRLELEQSGWQQLSWQRPSTAARVSRLDHVSATIKELVLVGHPTADLASLARECFPNLSSLNLSVWETDHFDYSTHIVALLPTSLTELTLRTGGHGWAPITPCDRLLSHLVNLEHLYLGNFTFEKDVIVSLRHFPKLETLGFGPDAFLPISRLEEIAIGPGRITSLRKIILDQVEGKEGWKIDEDGDGVTLHPDHAAKGFHMGPGWLLPDWVDSEDNRVKKSEFEDLSAKIRAQGIRVEGTMIEAFRVHVAWIREISLCMIAYAFETGDFDECRQAFGNEFADRILKAYEAERDLNDSH